MALRGMSQANMDLGILQETKLTDGIYTRGSAVTDFVDAESNWHLPTRRLPGRVAHILPTVPKFFPSPLARLPRPVCRCSRFPSPLARPHRYLSM